MHIWKISVLKWNNVILRQCSRRIIVPVLSGCYESNGGTIVYAYCFSVTLITSDTNNACLMLRTQLKMSTMCEKVNPQNAKCYG